MSRSRSSNSITANTSFSYSASTSLSEIVLGMLKCGEVFGYLPYPMNQQMTPRQAMRNFIFFDLWGHEDYDY